MKTSLSFIINGKPIAKQRHRVHNGIMYDPQSKEKNECKKLISEIMAKDDLRPLEGAIGANIIAKFPIPQSWSKKKRKEALEKGYVITKPDCDNLEKFYLDCMNKIAYDDDAQIAEIFTQKIYDEEPKTEIELYSLEEIEET